MRTTAELLANVAASGQYSRGNRYEVSITPPSALSVPRARDGLGRLEMNCSAASLPSRMIATREHSPGGAPVRKMPHSVQFDDMQLTFRLSDDLLERTLFEEWQGMVFDDTWGNLGYLDEYGGVVEVKKTSRRGSGSIVAKYVLHDAWPISVGQVDVGDENGEISVVNVGFAYRHWTRE